MHQNSFCSDCRQLSSVSSPCCPPPSISPQATSGNMIGTREVFLRALVDTMSGHEHRPAVPLGSHTVFFHNMSNTRREGREAIHKLQSTNKSSLLLCRDQWCQTGMPLLVLEPVWAAGRASHHAVQISLSWSWVCFRPGPPTRPTISPSGVYLTIERSRLTFPSLLQWRSVSIRRFVLQKGLHVITLIEWSVVAWL